MYLTNISSLPAKDGTCHDLILSQVQSKDFIEYKQGTYYTPKYPNDKSYNVLSNILVAI